VGRGCGDASRALLFALKSTNKEKRRNMGCGV
jgi:hypothetical protein